MSLPLLETPTYELVLPSTNKKIKFRPFLVKEHKILMTLQDAETTEIVRVIKDLISVCTFEKLNVDKLPNFDMEYIFLNLRAKSIGENVKTYDGKTLMSEKMVYFCTFTARVKSEQYRYQTEYTVT